MRTWIYNRIRGLGDIPAAFGAGSAMRVISSGSADMPAKPFIVVSMGVEQPVPGMPAEAGLKTIPFTVYVHDTPGSMLHIDDAAVALQNGLPVPAGAVVGSMSVYECRWTETGQDGFDDHWGTNVRPVRFALVTRRS